MNRREIMDECPEGHEEWLKSILDHFEDKFNEIRDKLAIDNISKLDQVEEAYDLAESTGQDLY